MRMALVTLCAATMVGCQCTNSVVVKPGTDGGVADSGSVTGGGGGGGGGGATGGGGGGGAATCNDGDACGDGGTCAGGTCCAAGRACGSQCCQNGYLCSFERCVEPLGSCRETSDCMGNEYCDVSGVQPAVLDAGVCVMGATEGQCVDDPPVCPPDAGAASGRTCVEPCRFVRPAGQLNPVVRYSWGDPMAAGTPNDVMMAPIVAQLTDDDCDGRITAQDQPEIVVVTFASGAYTAVGTVHALTVSNGALVERWATPGLINAASQLASGNFDLIDGNEVVGCGPNGVVALKGTDGTLLWSTATASCTTIAIADLDGNGDIEVITESKVLRGNDGVVLRDLPVPANNTIADIDGDGFQDVVTAGQVSNRTGVEVASQSGVTGYVAVGDLNVDGQPEIVSVNPSTHTLTVWSYDATQPNRARLIRTGLDINQTLSPSLCPTGSAGNVGGGGPPTIGDFNADGFPDVALAGGVGYAVFDGAKLMNTALPADQTLLWIRQTRDCSSAQTGSTLFDFDGDGRVEAVYADEITLHIYDSATGTDRFTACNTSGTLIEYPLVADVDSDGQADLIVASNAYAYGCANGDRTSGVRVFGSANRDWVVTRRVWNQHTYSVTNIDESGRVPQNPQRNWVVPGLNNFRQNKQPGQEFAAADAVVSMGGSCTPQGIAFDLVVRNVGEASMPAGVRVDLVVDPLGTPRVFGSVTTTRALGPSQAETFQYVTMDDVAGKAVIARIVATGLRQCRTDNDESTPPIVGCIN
ncbi:MAG: VCBS repeat-containing protein [Archangium sp.]